MSKAGDEVEVAPPRVGDSGDKNSPKHGTPKGSRVEELSSELMQLKLQRKIDKLKKKLKDSKSRQLTSSSSSNEESDASFEEEVKGKRRRKGDKRSYNTTSFNYDNLHPSSAVTASFKAKTRCSSYVCPGSSCHTYGQNVSTENQCLYCVVSYYKNLLQVQKGLNSGMDTILPQAVDRGFRTPRRSHQQREIF
jgi:hypothetical protein